MTAPLDSKVWLITGCSSGLGQSIAQAVYNAGHHVVATARKTSTLSYLPNDPKVLKLTLDVTSKGSIISALQSAVDTFGRLDVIVNNAGYGMMGDTEVIPEADARLLVETLFWGPVFVMQEAVRIFREVNNPKGHGGTIVNISSMGGSITVAGNAFYHAGKFALEGFAQSMAKEMQPQWNIRFLLVAPGGVRTNFAGSEGSALKVHPRHPAYNTASHPLTQMLSFINDPAREGTKADPDICATLLFDAVMGNTDKPLPVRLAMGSDAYYIMKQELDRQVEEIVAWKRESESCSPAGDGDVAEIRRWRDA